MTFAFYCWSVVGSLAPTVCRVEFWFGCRGAVDAMAIMGASWIGSIGLNDRIVSQVGGVWGILGGGQVSLAN